MAKSYQARLRAEIRRITNDSGEIDRIRSELRAARISDDDPRSPLPDSKVKAWRTKRRLPLVAIEGAAIGMRVCLKHLGNAHAVMPDGFMDGPQEIEDETVDKSEAADEIPSEMVRSHFDALKTTWLYGKRAFHFVRVEEAGGVPDESPLGAQIWRFFQEVKVVPPTFEPRVLSHSTHLVHGSSLDGNESLDQQHLEDFGLEGREGEGVHSDLEDDPNRVDFIARLAHSDPPLTCGYTYHSKGRFSRHENVDQKYDAFSGMNALPVQHGVVAVSLPLRHFRHLESAEGVAFAIPFPMLPRIYSEKIADKARRGVLGARHGLYSTWARTTENRRRIDQADDLWPFANFTKGEECASFIKAAAGQLFGRDRVVFAARFDLPNPLAYQSITWRLAEKMRSRPNR